MLSLTAGRSSCQKSSSTRSNLRRPGRDRHRECAVIRETQEVAGTADRNRRGSRNHQPLGVRPAADFRSHRWSIDRLLGAFRHDEPLRRADATEGFQRRRIAGSPTNHFRTSPKPHAEFPTIELVRVADIRQLTYPDEPTAAGRSHGGSRWQRGVGHAPMLRDGRVRRRYGALTSRTPGPSPTARLNWCKPSPIRP